MLLEQWLPGPVRVRIKRAATNLKAARATWRQPARPLFETRHRRPPPTAGQWVTMDVVDVVRQTPQSITILLGGPPLARSPHPGQFITLGVTIDGQQVRRPYSLCTDPNAPGPLGVTVKRVAGGLVSNHLNDHLKPGDQLQAFGPSGQFGLTPQGPQDRRHLVLIAAGSGITPIMSIIRAFCARAPHAKLDLFFGNHDLQSIIFHKELSALAHTHPNLNVTHVLSAPPPNHHGPQGRLNADTLRKLLPINPQAHYLICGPGPMMDAAQTLLQNHPIPHDHIHTERFTPKPARPTSTAPPTGAVHTVRFSQQHRTLNVSDNQTLLEAGLAAGIDMPFSCAVGGCGACRVKLISGEVTMAQHHCLTQDELNKNHCLACVSKPRGPVVIDL